MDYRKSMVGPPLAYSAKALQQLKFYTVPKSPKLRETLARLRGELQGFVYSDEKLKTKWKEADHPRGQPDNPGQFVKTEDKSQSDPRQKPRAIPEGLFSEDTVIEKKPKPAPVIEHTFRISQDKPAPIGRALQAVNPNFSFKKQDTLSVSYKKNCQNCAIAYELQRRGYKVTAMPHSGKAVQGEISNALEVFDSIEYQRAARGKTDLEQELLKSHYPNGSRFVISQELKRKKEAEWHNYIAEKINGEIRYFDPQEGNSDASGILKKIRIRAGKYQLFFGRVDDKPLKEHIDFTKVIKPMDNKESVDKTSG